MTTTKDKLEFALAMGRHTRASLRQVQALMRYAGTLHRLDVERCNRPELPEHKAKVARIQRHVEDLATIIGIVTVHFTWEPMAPPIVLTVQDRFSNYAGDEKGICVPG